MTDPCEGKYDIVSRLRDHTNRDDNDIAEAAAIVAGVSMVAYYGYKKIRKMFA
jgi:hypothetical protein